MRRLVAGLLTTVMALCAALPAAAQQSTTTGYTYDANGRLKTVTLPDGNVTVYEYDASGNITSIQNVSSATVSIVGIEPAQGAVGSRVAITGTGFSAVAAQNTVAFTSASGTVTATVDPQTLTTTHMDVTVPVGAVTGRVFVTAPAGGPVESDTDFTVVDGPAITSLAPARGSAGLDVTITGTGFSENVSGNEVRFNGILATTISATPTSLVARIPSGRATGQITVATANGSAASSGTFTALPTPYSTDDVEFFNTSPITLATPVSVNFTQPGAPNPNRAGFLKYNGTAGQRLTLTRTTGDVSFAPFAIFTPDLEPLATASGTFFDIPALPVTGEYTIVLDPAGTTTGTNSQQVKLDLASVVTGTITPGVPKTIDNVTSTVRLSFPGTTNQRVCVRVETTGTIALLLRKPDNTAAVAQDVGVSGPPPGRFIDTTTLTASGTYAVEVVPQFPQTAYSLTVKLFTVPPDESVQIIRDGIAVPLVLTDPGRNGYLWFDAEEDEQFSVRITNRTPAPSSSTSTIRVVHYDGNVLGASIPSNGFSADFLAVTCPSAGRYAISLNPQYDLTEGATFELLTRPAVNGTISSIHSNGTGGSAVPVAATAPLQEIRLSLSVAAAQQIRLRKTETSGHLAVRVETPTGGFVAQVTFFNSPEMSDLALLPAAGTYVLLCQFTDPETSPPYTGSGTLAVYDGNSFSGTLVADDSTTITFTPGDAYASLIVPAEEGQQLKVQATGGPVGVIVTKQGGDVYIYQGTVSPEDGEVEVVEAFEFNGTTPAPESIRIQILNVNSPYAGTAKVTLVTPMP